MKAALLRRAALKMGIPNHYMTTFMMIKTSMHHNQGHSFKASFNRSWTEWPTPCGVGALPQFKNVELFSL